MDINEASAVLGGVADESPQETEHSGIDIFVTSDNPADQDDKKLDNEKESLSAHYQETVESNVQGQQRNTGDVGMLLQKMDGENDSHSVLTKRSISAATKEDLEDDLSCTVCLQLAVHPTTLVCGHTSCRMCLAQWYFSSDKKTCPICRQAYQGLPMTNIQLRKMIHKLYPGKAKEREDEYEADKEAKKLVEKYDNELQGRSKNKSDTDIASFCAGILIAICSFITIYLAWYWQTADTNLLVMKPVQSWKPRDVSQWLTELRWAEDYANAALDNHIDGNVLLSLSEKYLEEQLNMTKTTHQKAFLLALELLRENGLKMPATIWEYKAMYPGRSLFLVFGMKDFPRTCLLYSWIYFPDDLFLPFVKVTTEPANEDLLQEPSPAEDISTSQWVTFLVYALLVPEWLVIVFAMQMFSQHFFSPMFAITTAIFYQMLDFLAWKALIEDFSFRSVWLCVKSHLKQLTSAFIFMVFWPIVPHLICDIFFYGALYISPVQATFALYQKITAINQ